MWPYGQFDSPVIKRMGGNAIKKDGKSICGRLPKAQYEIVRKFVLSVLRKHFICEIVLELPGKESFGDMDVLYNGGDAAKIVDMSYFIKNYFEVSDSTHIFKNGYVLSFALDCSKFFDTSYLETKYFQIDLLCMESTESIEMARFYFAYGDFGSLIGRMANYYGLKFGERGLWCDVYEQTVKPTLPFDVRKTLGKVFLSSNPRNICHFFGYDYDSWKDEIPKLTDPEFLANYAPKLDENCEIFPDIPKSYKFIFDWLISSRFFDDKMFLFLNTEHRSRQEKRPFYKSFLEYLGIYEVSHASVTGGESGGVHLNRQSEAIHYFKKTDDLEILLKDLDRKNNHQSKFSGSHLIACYKDRSGIELENKVVGLKISLFKKFCTEKSKCNNWEDFLDKNDKSVVDEYLREFVTK